MARNGQVKDKGHLAVKHSQIVPLGKKNILRCQETTFLEQQTNNARQEKEQMLQYWLQAKHNWNNLCKGGINK